MRFLLSCGTLAILLVALSYSACTSKKQDSDQLREKTAEATAELKKDAQSVAQGVREGWNRDKALDLNTATKDQLQALPGMTPQRADRIIAGRPYKNPSELTEKHLLTQAEYGKIADKVTVKR
jgi:DNA uptake protein ComE-like DNA-binding protein